MKKYDEESEAKYNEMLDGLRKLDPKIKKILLEHEDEIRQLLEDCEKYS